MKISRVGFTRCSGCLSHVKVHKASTCPFCGEELREAATIGGQTMEALRGSRAALVAMGLAGGVTFAVACGEPDPKPDPNNEPINVQPEYGVFDPDSGVNSNPNQKPGPDMGGEPDAGEPINVQPEYGVFDPDAG